MHHYESPGKNNSSCLRLRHLNRKNDKPRSLLRELIKPGSKGYTMVPVLVNVARMNA